MSRRSSGRRAHTQKLHLALALLPALGVAGCKGNDGNGPGAAPGTAGASGAAVAGQSGKASAAAIAAERAELQKALEALPADTHLAFALQSPSTVLKLLDYAGLRGQHADLFGMATREMTREIGMDLLDPEVYAKRFGIDLEGPMVFAMLRLNDPRGVIGVRLANREKFIEGLMALFEKAEKRKLPQNPFPEDSTWIPLDKPGRRSEAGILVQKDRAWLVLHGRSDAALMGWDARRIAQSEPAERLGGRDDFKAALKGLAGGGTAVGYVNTQQLIALAVGEASGRADLDRLREKVDARKAGLGDASELPELEAELARSSGGKAERFAASAAVSVLIQSLVGGMSEVGLGFDAEPDGIRVQLAMKTSDSALVQRLSTDGPAAPQVFALGIDRTTGAFSLSADVEGVLALVRQANLVTGGRAMENITDNLKNDTGLDLLTEVVPNVTGSLALQVYLPQMPPARPNQQEIPTARPDFRLAIGVKDAKVAQPLLDRLVATALGDEKPMLENGRPTLPGPDDRRVQLALVGNELIVSNVSDAFDIAAKAGDTQAAVLKIWPESTHPNSAVGQLNWPQLVLHEEARSSLYFYDYERPIPDGVDAKAWEALQVERKALDRAREDEKLASARQGLSPFGPLLGRLDTRGDHADLRLVQRLNVSPAKALDTVVAAIWQVEKGQKAHYEKADAIREKMRALENGAPPRKDLSPEEMDALKEALQEGLKAPTEAVDAPQVPLEEDDGKE